MNEPTESGLLEYLAGKPVIFVGDKAYIKFDAIVFTQEKSQIHISLNHEGNTLKTMNASGVIRESDSLTLDLGNCYWEINQ